MTTVRRMTGTTLSFSFLQIVITAMIVGYYSLFQQPQQTWKNAMVVVVGVEAAAAAAWTHSFRPSLSFASSQHTTTNRKHCSLSFAVVGHSGFHSPAYYTSVRSVARKSTVPRRSRHSNGDDDEVERDPSPPLGSVSSLADDTSTLTAEDHYNHANNNNKIIVVEAFHRDMLRVLESRRPSSTFTTAGDDSSSSSSIPLRRGRQSSTTAKDSHSIRHNHHRRDPDGAERCRCLLQHLQHTLRAANETSFQIVMRAFLQRGRTRWRDTTTNGSGARWVCAADQLEQLLEELQEYLLVQQQEQQEQLPEGDRTPIPPISTTTFNYVLQAYAQCATPHTDFATRAQNLLLEQQQPNLESYLHVVHALAWQQANRKPAREAQQALDLLQQHILVAVPTSDDDDNKDTAAMQMQAYGFVMEAYSKSLNGASMCLDLLEQMKQLNATYPNDAKVSQYLDVEVYSNAILAWSKQEGNNNNNITVHHAEQVHALLLELLDHVDQNSFGPTAVPPLIAFNSVITAWGRAQRPDQVEWVLQRLQKARQRHPDALQPNAIFYNSILHSFLSGPLPPDAALEKSLQLLQYMHDESKSGRQPAIAPDAYSYYTLLKCWIQTGNQNKNNNKNNNNKQFKNNKRPQQHKFRDDHETHRPPAAEQAEKLLHKMEECWNAGDTSVPPSRLIYNMVMNAYAKSQLSQAAPRAWQLLRRMQESTWVDCHPDIISYTSCLECLAQPNCSLPNPASLAAQLLDEAMERFRALECQSENDVDIEPHRPNLRTYTMAIQTLAQHGGSARQARDWLTQLCDDYQRTKLPSLKPNTYPYNYVLNCASQTVARADGISELHLEAFQIAAQTFQEMRHSSENNNSAIQPDSYSYAFWFKCCHNLLSPGSDLQRQCAQLAWKECQHRGLATGHVIQRYQQIMGGCNDGSESQDSMKRTSTKSEAPPLLAWSFRSDAATGEWKNITTTALRTTS